MKTWWKNASLREKQMVTIAGIALSVFILYERTLVQLTDTVNQMRASITENQTLLLWMQDSEQRIKHLALRTKSDTIPSTAALMNLLQTDINNTHFAHNVTQLQQTDNEAVQLRLQKVSFDEVMQWLIQFNQTHAIKILQANFTKGPTTGTVDADLKIGI